MIKIFLLVSFSTLLFAEYTNCSFKTKNYEEICKKALKRSVSVDYVNRFLLSSKVDNFDEKSFILFQPKELKRHHKQEKKANNALVKYIPTIVKHLKEYKEVYDFSEKKYGINREIIAAIFMKETRLGAIKPRHDAFEVFNTLVVKVKPDSSRNRWLIKMGKENMVSIISYCYKKGLKPTECNFASSYAGAVGIPQFMPHNFHLIEGYKKELGDLNSMSDAILSASRFLNKTAKFRELLDWSKIPSMKKVEADWYEYDFTHKNSSFVYASSKRSGKKYNCFACNKKELIYLKGYIQKIMRYNNSSTYAVGVMRLAYDAHQKLNQKGD